MKTMLIVILVIAVLGIGLAAILLGAKTNDISGVKINNTILENCSNTNTCKIDFTNSSVIVKEFTLNATRFKYDPETVIVNKGDTVIININNIDTLHGIRIPAFGIKDNETIKFIANQTGEFDFYCTVFCGSEHKEMKGKLVVQ